MSNETDRELLELAARAAGYTLKWGETYIVGDDEVDCTDMSYVVSGQPDEADWHWSPLTDDGDALRLGAKLQLRTLCTNAGASAESTHRDHPPVFAWGERMDYGDAEASAATRRAIVLAAAEIGRAMK